MQSEALFNRILDVPRLRIFIFLMLVQLVLMVWVTWRFSGVPEVPSEVGEDLIVKGYPEGTTRESEYKWPVPGSRILSVNDVDVSTFEEYTKALRRAEGDAVSLRLQRFDVQVVQALSFDSFPPTGLPPGVREGDRPIGMACQSDGAYLEMRMVDLEALRELVRQRGGRTGDVQVVFNRPEETSSQLVPLKRSAVPYWIAGLFALSAAMIGLLLLAVQRASIVKQGVASSRALYIAGLLSLGSLAMVALFGAKVLRGDPMLFIVGMFGFALFKPLSLELHLRDRSSWFPVGTPVKIALFIAPLIFFGQLVAFRVQQSQANDPEAGSAAMQQVQTFWGLLLGAWVLFTLVDVAALLLRHQRLEREGEQGITVNASNIGLGFSALASMAAVYFMVRDGDAIQAGYALGAALGGQLIGDFLGILDLPRAHWMLSGKSEMLSPQLLQDFIARFDEIFPDERVWIVSTLFPVLGSSTKPRSVRIKTLHEAERAPSLVFEQPPEHWVDLLDLLDTEGGTIPRDFSFNSDDLMTGMAQRLGINCVWPIALDGEGEMARVYLVVEQTSVGDQWETPSLQQLPVEAIESLTQNIEEVSSALLYHSALSSIKPSSKSGIPAQKPLPTVRFSEPSKAPKAPKIPRKPTPKVSPPSLEKPLPLPMVSESETSSPGSSLQMTAQLRAMQAEVMRLHPADYADLTAFQKDAVSRLLSADVVPVLLAGEAGVGKAFIARLAHNSTGCEGAFVRLPALELPTAILPIELFGDEQNPGRIEAARAGTLLIEGADRLPPTIFHRLIKHIQDLDAPPWVILSVECLPPEEGADPTHESRRALALFEPSIASLIGSAVFVPPLREQPEEIERLADYFLHRAAMRHGRVITELSAESLVCLHEHSWPGNQQEMKNTLENAVLFCKTECITPKDLHLGTSTSQRESLLERDLEEAMSKLEILQERNEILRDTFREAEREKGWSREP